MAPVPVRGLWCVSVCVCVWWGEWRGALVYRELGGLVL